jgi:AcrR family transcriptional regulator
MSTDVVMKRVKPADWKTTPIDDQPPRRRAILAAAFEVLMDKGYAGASTLDIATRAKVSKRELYAEFGSKRGILEAMITTTAERMKVSLEAHDIADRKSFAQALTRYGISTLAELTHPAVVAINRLAVAEADRDSELGQILDRQGRTPHRDALAALFTKAQSAGILGPGDPYRMGGQFFSLLFGDLMLRLLLGVTQPPDAREIKRRTAAATEAVLALNGASEPLLSSEPLMSS